jgi:hypothetical protein
MLVAWAIATTVCLAAQPVTPTTLAIPPFCEIGSVPAGSGMELALFAAEVVDTNRYHVKPRIHIKPLLQENLWDNAQRLREVLQNLEAQQFLLGSVSKTGGDYEICYFLVDRLGNVLLPKDRVGAGSWPALRQHLHASLAVHHVARAPAPVTTETWRWPALAAATVLSFVLPVLFYRRLRGRRPKKSLRLWHTTIATLLGCQEQLNHQLAAGQANAALTKVREELATLLVRLQALSEAEITTRGYAWRRILGVAQSLQRACLAAPPATAEMTRSLQELFSILSLHIGNKL